MTQPPIHQSRQRDYCAPTTHVSKGNYTATRFKNYMHIYIYIWKRMMRCCITLTPHFAHDTRCLSLSHAGIAISGKIFSRKSLFNNDFLEILLWYVFARLIFDGKLRYDANESTRAMRRESARSRLSSKLYFFVRVSRRVNTELAPRHGSAWEKKQKETYKYLYGNEYNNRV